MPCICGILLPNRRRNPPMPGPDKVAFDDLNDALKAAGEETRLRILALLFEAELTVSDLTDILRASRVISSCWPRPGWWRASAKAPGRSSAWPSRGRRRSRCAP